MMYLGAKRSKSVGFLRNFLDVTIMRKGNDWSPKWLSKWNVFLTCSKCEKNPKKHEFGVKKMKYLSSLAFWAAEKVAEAEAVQVLVYAFAAIFVVFGN